MRVVSAIKNFVVPKGRTPRRILTGPFGGLTMNLDLTTQTQVFAGTFEREVQGWLQTFSADARTAIDVGTAEGEYSLFFLRKTGAQRVLAFEPMDSCRTRFRENLALNGLERDSRLRISDKTVGAADSADMAKLDSILDEVELPVVVKVDVDGAEMDVLRGAGKLIALPRVRWIIETHTPALEQECIEHMKAAGYWTRIVPNAWWRILLPEMREAAHRPENHNRWFIAARPEDISMR
jgi:Methyltransferase FkbM domain